VGHIGLRSDCIILCMRTAQAARGRGVGGCGRRRAHLRLRRRHHGRGVAHPAADGGRHVHQRRSRGCSGRVYTYVYGCKREALVPKPLILASCVGFRQASSTRVQSSYGRRSPLKNIRARGRIIFLFFPRAARVRALKIRQINSAILKFPMVHGTVRHGFLPRNSSHGTSDA
jgi:hypothetical protein